VIDIIPEGPDKAKYFIVEVPVTPAQAKEAMSVVNSSVGTDTGAWRMLQNDCTTYSSKVLDAAGVATPKISTPSVNLLSVAAVSPGIVKPLRIAAVITVVTGAATRGTHLEEQLQQSVPSEHVAGESTALEQRMQMSIPDEHQ
jgi:hypothetical protein